MTPLVEAERWVSVGHQTGVPGDAQHPAVEAEDEVEELLRVAAREEQEHSGNKNQEADEPGPPHDLSVAPGAHRVAGAADE